MKLHRHTLVTRLCAVITALILGGALSIPTHAFASGGKANGGGATGGGGSTSSGGGGGGGSTSTTTDNTSTSATSEPVRQAGRHGASTGDETVGTTTISTTVTTPTGTQTPYSNSLTCTSPVTIGGVVPHGVCTYNVDPYYPTLSFMTLHLDCDSINDNDGSYYYVLITTANNIYTVPTSSFAITSGAGSCVISAYVQPGATVTGITVMDINGQVILSGN